MGLIGWIIAGNVAAGLCLGLGRWWRSRQQRDLVITALRRNGEMTTLELRSVGAGVGVYQLLMELEDAGIVERLNSGITYPERGGLPRYLYRLKETL